MNNMILTHIYNIEIIYFLWPCTFCNVNSLNNNTPYHESLNASTQLDHYKTIILYNHLDFCCKQKYSNKIDKIS